MGVGEDDMSKSVEVGIIQGAPSHSLVMETEWRVVAVVAGVLGREINDTRWRNGNAPFIVP